MVVSVCTKWSTFCPITLMGKLQGNSINVVRAESAMDTDGSMGSIMVFKCLLEVVKSLLSCGWIGPKRVAEKEDFHFLTVMTPS